MKALEELVAFVEGLCPHDRNNLYAMREWEEEKLLSLAETARRAGNAQGERFAQAAYVLKKLLPPEKEETDA